MLKWQNGKNLTADELQQLTGLTIKRPAMLARLRKAEQSGVILDTLAQQIAVLVNPMRSDSHENTEISLLDDFSEAKRHKTLREALERQERWKQAEIETRRLRGELVDINEMLPAWENMIVAMRVALQEMIPALTDQILGAADRDTALERAENELRRHVKRLSEFSLTRTLTDTGEEWDVEQPDL